jgi:ribosome-associated protein
MTKQTVLSDFLAEMAVKGMEEKKGKKIIKIDLKGVHAAVADYFIICHGDSDKQVQALARSVEEVIQKNAQDKPISREGEELGRWILLDYADIVVHIFLGELREFYSLEDLWSDGEFTTYEDL